MRVQAEHEVLDRLLEELDSGAGGPSGGDDPGDWSCQRRHTRCAFRTDCVIRLLSSRGTEVLAVSGRTRNLSRSGVSILLKHVCTVGDAAEVELHLPGQPTTFIAGLIQFVRYAGHGYHELGVAIRSAGPAPIFSHDPMSARQALNWLRPPAEPSGTGRL